MSGRKPRSSISSASSSTSALDPAEHQVALLGQVEQPAGGADDHVDALAQRGDLRLVGAAAVDGGDPHAEVLRRRRQVLGDLHAQLAGRAPRPGPAGRPGAVGGLAVDVRGGLLGRRDEPLQQRHAEAERLAHAGAGLADDVVAGQRERQGELLDGERALDAGLGQRAHDLLADAQLGEGGGIRLDRGAGLQRVRLVDLVGRVRLGCGPGRRCRVWVSGRSSDGQDDRLSPRTGARASARRPPAALWRITGRPGGRADEALHAPGRCGAGSVLRR